MLALKPFFDLRHIVLNLALKVVVSAYRSLLGSVLVGLLIGFNVDIWNCTRGQLTSQHLFLITGSFWDLNQLFNERISVDIDQSD